MADKILRGNFPGTLIFHVGDGDSKITITVTQTEDGALIEATDKNGETSAFVYNGKDGYTPQKGIDYVDGKDGDDGFSPTVSVSAISGGHRISVTDKNGTKTVDVMNGEDGDDYTLTPADKNEIAELAAGMVDVPDYEDIDLSDYAKKNELPTKVSQLANDKGYLTEHQDISGKLDASALPEAVNDALAQAKESGEFKGEPGYTPKKGVDYWTEADQKEVTADATALVLAEVQSTTIQQTPLFANSIAECTDTAKIYVLPDGFLYAYVKYDRSYINQLPISLDGTGGVYNNKGYKENTRWSVSSGSEGSADGIYLSGYIPVKPGAIVRIKNITMNQQTEANQGCTVQFFTGIGVHALQAQHNKWSGDSTTVHSPVWDNAGQLVQFTVPSDTSYAYIRLQSEYFGADSIVTVNEEIVESTGGYSWENTGHAFVPADYENRIVALERTVASVAGDLAVYGIVDDKNNVFMSGILTPGTYTLKYQNTDGTTSEIGTFDVR